MSFDIAHLSVFSQLVKKQMKAHIHSEAELSAFESQWGISLPETYRSYLSSIGGGCSALSKVDLLEDWSYHPENLPKDYLRKNFPHKKAWNDKSLINEEGWSSPYFSDDLVEGSISIKSTGCEGRDILVISGDLRGEIWHDDRACNGEGIYPLLSKDGSHLHFDEYISKQN